MLSLGEENNVGHTVLVELVLWWEAQANACR